MIRWVEHFFVLPIRWFRLHCETWFTGRQRCKVCGCRDKFDFHIEDEVWQKVVPIQYQNRVVCLACFDDFAKKKEVDYSPSLKEIYFAGDKVSFQFSVRRSSSK
jgi:hypothetical protein